MNNHKTHLKNNYCNLKHNKNSLSCSQNFGIAKAKGISRNQELNQQGPPNSKQLHTFCDDMIKSISYISPKKVAYFQEIDRTCLNTAEQKNICGKSIETESLKIQNASSTKNIEINYKQIKQCLSPRSNYTKNQFIKKDRPLIQQKKSQNKQKDFYEQMIIDLKLEIIQKQKQEIEEKDLKIYELQKDLNNKEKSTEMSNISIPSLSSNNDQKYVSHFTSEFSQCDEKCLQKITYLQQALKEYQSRFKKFEIQLYISKKIKFDQLQNQKQLISFKKINKRLSKKIEMLQNQNKKLLNQKEQHHRYRYIEDDSIDFEFSPDKYNK